MTCRIAHLLDDCSLGGVTRALEVFESPTLKALTTSTLVQIEPGSTRAPVLDADVIITHFTPNWRRLAFLFSLRRANRKARIIHVEHSYTEAWEAVHVRRRARFRLMLALATRLVDKVVCVSNAQAGWLARAARISRRRLVVINPHAENPGLEALALPSPAEGRPLRIGAYGRFSEQKGFDTLVRAVRNGWFGECELLLGGFGPQATLLRALAGDCEQIRFTGRVDRVADFLDRCDVVAVPSRWEAYGMVATEAREAGRPILVAPVDGLPEQAEGSGLTVDFTDPQSIAEALAQIAAQGIESMALAARRQTTDSARRTREGWAQLLAPQPSRNSSAAASMMASASSL